MNVNKFVMNPVECEFNLVWCVYIEGQTDSSLIFRVDWT